MTTPQHSQQPQQNPTPKNSLWKVFLPIVALIALSLIGLSWVKTQVTQTKPASQDASRSEGAGGRFPDFELKEFQGGTKKFSDLKAKVVFVNFWATWCEACMVEMPSIVALRKAYAGRGLEVVAINVDEKPEAVLPGVMKKLGIDFPVYTDTEGKLADIFDVHAIPLTVVLDRERNALLTHNGEYDWNSEKFRSRMDGWLAK